ncbi:MAG: hypothetical protein CSA76_01500 [Spirochaetales bacterium]|nr:MAG: hypothetical protein CSA76_01500 [Spirochaetales bacterium]
MKLRLYYITAVCLMISLLPACSRRPSSPLPVTGGILTPRTPASSQSSDSSMQSSELESQPVLPLVNPGPEFSIVTLFDANLDLEQSDEQVIMALPVDDTEKPLQLMIASTHPQKNTYEIVWSSPLSSRTLTGLSFRTDDLTGNGQKDMIITGFDDKDRHVTEIFAARNKNNLSSFRSVFSLVADGNIDIINQDRSSGYWSGQASGIPYQIMVQQTDPSAENNMDILETLWTWDSRNFRFQKSKTRQVKADVIQEERISQVYKGGAEVYKEYLRGAWFKESGNGSYQDMVYFDPEADQMMFFDGEIQEVFSWGTSHRTTAKRLYTKVYNLIIPALFDNVNITAEAWDRIYLDRVVTPEKWDGTYRRLGSALQNILDSQSRLSPLVQKIPLSGVWKGFDGEEVVFTLPAVEWKTQDKIRTGTASIFTMNGVQVFQVRFIKKNGAPEETVNWIIQFQEDRDDTRIIRSISITPAILQATGIRSTGENARRFEQIEIISPGSGSGAESESETESASSDQNAEG